MARLGHVVLGLLGIAVILLVACSAQVGSSQVSTCLLCRLCKRETVLFGLTRVHYDENECSRWYPAHVELRHDHIWEPSTCTTLLNAFGRPVGVACATDRSPIWVLPESTQIEVYMHIPDREAAKSVFASLADAKTHDDRIDEEDKDRGHLIVRSLIEWRSAEFPDTWDDWWKTWWDKHVAQHKERLEWLHSDSGMNLEDWKKRHDAAAAETTKKPESSR